MVLDEERDPAYNFSPQEYFEDLCTVRNKARRSLENLGLSDCASIINKLPGNVLELAAIYEAATHVSSIATGDKPAGSSLPTKVSARSVIFATAWMGVSTCQRFMLQEEPTVISVSCLFWFILCICCSTACCKLHVLACFVLDFPCLLSHHYRLPATNNCFLCMKISHHEITQLFLIFMPDL